MFVAACNEYDEGGYGFRSKTFHFSTVDGRVVMVLNARLTLLLLGNPVQSWGTRTPDILYYIGLE